jgi:hypothetical protein
VQERNYASETKTLFLVEKMEGRIPGQSKEDPVVIIIVVLSYTLIVQILALSRRLEVHNATGSYRHRIGVYVRANKFALLLDSTLYKKSNAGANKAFFAFVAGRSCRTLITGFLSLHGES